ncbi:MAG: 23S rRNA (uracil(1939)-C(5))-methyltransferase RlmD [bacterium]|nr:23S rRNA (uracil(1939)-C(5))-methyltransferase RlmD [bacterium]
MGKLKRGECVELCVEGLDERGQGLARWGAFTVRIRGGVPGDRIRARIRHVRYRKRLADAQKEELIESSVKRVVPRCSHFGTCGGCLWQDIPYEVQVNLKQQLVDQCLQEVGIDVQQEPPVVADSPFFYRNKMEFSFGVSANGGLDLGLHIPGRFDRIFDLEACYLQSEISNGLVNRIRSFVQEAELGAYDLKRHEGLLRFLTIREGKQTGEVMVVITTSAEVFPQAEKLGSALMEAFPEVKSVIHTVNRRKAQVAYGDEEIVLAGDAIIRERLGEFIFEVSPTSFFQTNTHQAERLYLKVLELADLKPEDEALDVYCGTGGISLFLSKQVRRVVGIEASEAAIQDALRNSAQNGVTNCEFIAGPAEEVLGQLKTEHFDVAVTDPPRPGMHPKALNAFIALQPERMVYVSCNPKALAQDLKRLTQAGYEVGRVQLVDMFPHTPHCEVLVRLTYGSL